MNTPTVTAPGPEHTVPRWSDLVAELIEQDPDLAPLLTSGQPDVVDGHLRLHPYQLLCDVAALVSWSGYLDTPVQCFVQPAGGSSCQLVVRGTLYSVPVELVGETTRDVPGGPGPAQIPMSVLTGIARDERAWFAAATGASA